MQQAHNKIVSFIWSIADDCLRDVYKRGKYRDVILPMIVLRRLDALLEDSKDKVMKEVYFQKKELKLADLDPNGLRDASGYVFYNASKWTLQTLYSSATNSQQLLLANFEDYLNGFSDNVKEVIEKFNLRSQIRHMVSKDVLLEVLEKFTSPYINLTNLEKIDPEGKKLPPLTNLGMGYVFEELIRKFNEENNEEAGEHFTPREVIKLMTNLVFMLDKDNLKPVIMIYDPACGSGGMLTEAQNFIKDPNGSIKAIDKDIYLYGKEINDETYAICKSDMMIKGNNPEHIRLGSTLSTNEFYGTTFHYMLSNPPYGKSWASEQKYIKDGKEVIDPRFRIKLKNYWGEEEELDAVPRSSDGQLLFLMEMIDKMYSDGSRIASVHNGSSLFTGDAGGGESNIRRYIIEQDMLEAIIQLPNNLFYNTGITTYIWLLNNNKPTERQGKVQLIDANHLYQKLRKNLGNKNCELTNEHIQQILNAYQGLEVLEAQEDCLLESQVFDNQDFGYYKVTIERPSRLKTVFTDEGIEGLLFENGLTEPMQWAYAQFGLEVYQDSSKYIDDIKKYCQEEELNLSTAQLRKLAKEETWTKALNLYQTAKVLQQRFTEVYLDFNLLNVELNAFLKAEKIKLSATEQKKILSALSVYDAEAEKVIKKVHKLSDDKLNNLLQFLGCREDELANFGYFCTDRKGEYIEYESESTLRDTEHVPLKEDIQAYFLREVKPYVEEAWIYLDKTQIGYEISFNKYFYKHQELRSLEEITADILALEKQSEGLITDILKG